jgi:hypothetical protein
MESTHRERLAVFAQGVFMRSWACFAWAASFAMFFFLSNNLCVSQAKV